MKVVGGNCGTGRLRIRAVHPPVFEIEGGASLRSDAAANFFIVDRRSIEDGESATASSAIVRLDRGWLLATVTFKSGHPILVAGTPDEIRSLQAAVFAGMEADARVTRRALTASPYKRAYPLAAGLAALRGACLRIGNWFLAAS